jgi:uncharacterized protein YegP (UPF0339 family)
MATQTEIYEGADGQWYWRGRNTKNHKIVMSGGEGYASKGNAKRAVRRLGASMLLKPIVIAHPRIKPGDY